jgi:hypothetical protein
MPGFLKLWFQQNPLATCRSEHHSLICDKRTIIRENLKLRKEGYYGRLWPSEYLWIGSDAGFGAYYVSTTGSQPLVYWYDWEEGEGSIVDVSNSEEQSAGEFLRAMREDLE